MEKYLDKIKNIIKSNYSFETKNISEYSKGYGGEVAKLETSDRNYFIKIFPSNTNNLESKISILNEVHNKGYKFMNFPIKRKDNHLITNFENKFLVVFNFINGKNVSKYDIPTDTYIDLITTLHGLKDKVENLNIKEEFNEVWLDSIWEIIDKFLSNKYTSPKLLDLQKYINSHINDIKSRWELFHKLANECIRSNYKLVPTHGDIFVNILKDEENEYYLVDWDTIKLGPRERDFWFLIERKEFLHKYLSKFPQAAIHTNAIQYYILFRYFDGLWGFLDGINTSENENDALGLVDKVYEVCFGWLENLLSKSEQ